MHEFNNKLTRPLLTVNDFIMFEMKLANLLHIKRHSTFKSSYHPKCCALVCNRVCVGKFVSNIVQSQDRFKYF